MKTYAPLLLALSAGPVAADPGHLTEVAGHGHWIALAALGVAAAVAALAVRKFRGKTDPEEAEEADTGESAQEA